jgi:hypothetical protein
LLHVTAFPKHSHEEWSKLQMQQKQQQQQDSILSEEEIVTVTASVTSTTTTTTAPLAVPTIASTTDAAILAMGQMGGTLFFSRLVEISTRSKNAPRSFPHALYPLSRAPISAATTNTNTTTGIARIQNQLRAVLPPE